MLNHRNTLSSRRRGMILLVVLAMLTLFTVIGITFVYLSDSQALSARINKDAENIFNPDIDPQMALSYVMSQLIYDVNDDTTGIYSSLRGHSLARNMYGWNYNSSATWLQNDAPYNGPGRLTYKTTGDAVAPAWIQGISNDQLLNYRYFSGDAFLRDPERLKIRSGPGDTVGSYVCCAVPYTYPDTNNVFLAVLDTNPSSATFNQVIVPSFHRPLVWGGPLNDQTNANWTTNQAGKYLTLRPRPADNTTSFPYPTGPYGDVKNLDGAPGGNDSIWIDIGAPIMIAPNGQPYKMLVAPLILELDGRVNLNVHGNIRNTSTNPYSHAGNQGWSPSEVNLSMLPFATDNTTNPPTPEWVYLFLGNPTTNARVLGRYGQSYVPGGTITSASAATPIVITTPSTASLVTGQAVVINGVQGNTAANGVWTITVINGTTFSLNGSTGNGASTGGGTWASFTGFYTQPRAWAPVDLNAVIDPTQTGAGGVTHVYAAPNGTTSAFPSFPAGTQGPGYGQGTVLEQTNTGLNTGTTNLPLAYNPLARVPGNRLLPLSDMDAFFATGG